MSRDDIRQARERRAKASKATKSKVAADRKNAASAKAWGERVMANLP